MTSGVKVLFDDDVERLANMGELVEVMREALRLQAEDKLVSPPRHYVKFPKGNLVFTIGGTPEFAGFRVYQTFGRVPHTGEFIPVSNPDAGPEDRQVIVVYDMETNQMQGVIVGNHISAYRAGSISAMAMDLMAPREVKTLTIMGTGHHATTQLLGAIAVRDFEEIRVFSRSAENRKRFVEKMTPRIKHEIVPCTSAKEAVNGADVVMSASNSATPIYDADWISSNAYVGSAGPKFKTTSELPAAIGARAAFICTDTPGQLEAYRDNHFLSGTADFDRVRPLNEWLDPEKRPKNAEGIRLFMLTGLAGTEVITGASVLKAAERGS